MGTPAGNDGLFNELQSERPNYALIHRLLDSGQADINAAKRLAHDFVTAFWFIQGGFGKQTVSDPYHPSGKIRLAEALTQPLHIKTNFEERLERFKAYFYPLLDILEDYGFDIMRGSSFRLQPDGTITHRMHAGWRILDLAPFRIMANYDMPRLIQFFERLYFSRGYAANDPRSTEAPGNPGVSYLQILLLTGSHMPALILYMIMKGADWTRPNYSAPRPNMPEGAVKHFASVVMPDEAAEMIARLQKQLGTNYITGPEGEGLRGFLVAVYGTVGGVIVLDKAKRAFARKKRAHALVTTPENYLLEEAAAGAGGQVGGRRRARVLTKRRRRTLKYRKRSA